MRLQCAICKASPQMRMVARIVKVESWLYQGGRLKQGVAMMICEKHLPIELFEALLLNSPSFSSNQVVAEQRCFDKEGE